MRFSHGHKRKGNTTREYVTWCGIKQRCYDENCPGFDRYGGRGIVVCDRWKDSFNNFYEDMGDKPKGYTIERKDNDGPYSPENCIWASRHKQANNRRTNVLLEYNNTTMTQAEWGRHLGVHSHFILNRLRQGIPFADIASGKVKPRKSPTKRG